MRWKLSMLKYGYLFTILKIFWGVVTGFMLKVAAISVAFGST